jgi:ABC-type multidrug transport system, ATPase and permease components
MLRLWNFFAGEKKSLILVSSLVFIDALVTLSVPYLIGLAVNQIGIRTGMVKFPMLIQILLVISLFYLMDAVLTFFQGWIMATSGQRIVMGLRSSLFGKLQKLPVAFFDRHSHGDIMSRLTNDIENIDVTISQSTVELINDVLMIAGSFLLMLWLSPLLTLATMIIVPLVFILTKTIAARTTRLFVRQQNVLGTLNGQIEESISGLSVVKAFSHEREAIRDFSKVNRQLTDVGMKAQVWSGFLMPLMNVINNLGFTVVAAVGGFLAVDGMITVGMIASFLTYSRQFARPLNDVASIFNTLQSAVAGAERVFEILDETDEPESLSAREIKTFQGRIVFRDVSFGYDPDHPILKHIDFRAEPGETLALVGPTGAGKTTIINLLSRFYDPDSGVIEADGTDIRTYRRSSYRSLFGIVLQDAYLFQGTILENIRYGKLDADDEEVRQAAEAAHADNFIEKTDKGYQTVIQGNGENLSEGQKQLLTIARAFLSDPRILVLDEATSHVDTQTEQHIQTAMARLMTGRTSFIIAHRLSTIRDADQILVVENGHIAEQGSHRQLIEKRGIYFNMYQDQFAGQPAE